MKNTTRTSLLLILLLGSCGTGKTKQEQPGQPDSPGSPSVQKAPDAPIPASAMAGNVLMGEWEAALVTSDQNSNGILDESERSGGFTTYKDYIKLEPDGSCTYTVARLTATYEIVEENGNRSIEVITRDGSRVRYGRIISLQPGELQLMKFTGGRDILVYQRP